MPVWECLQERRQKKLSRMLRRYEKDFVKSLTIFFICPIKRTYLSFLLFQIVCKSRNNYLFSISLILGMPIVQLH